MEKKGRDRVQGGVGLKREQPSLFLLLLYRSNICFSFSRSTHSLQWLFELQPLHAHSRQQEGEREKEEGAKGSHQLSFKELSQ